MSLRFVVPVFVLLVFAVGCHSPRAREHASESAAIVSRHLEGWFTSEAQAAADPSYFDVHLVAIPIWTERADGHWLYVEQAIASALDRPYRQRVYRVVERGAEVVSEIYELPDPAAWVAVWRNPGRIAELAPEDLSQKVGCDVTLEEVGDGEWRGGTGVGTCVSTRSGAAYATSEVVLASDRLESWDRGFDEAGSHVWGATEGPYIFLRVTREPRPLTAE